MVKIVPSNSPSDDPTLHNGIYTLEKLENNDEDLSRYDRIFSKNDDPRDSSILRWRYLQNPASAASETILAKDVIKDEDAALYTMMGVTAITDGEPRLAAQSLDTLTDRSHRRQGLFPVLAKRAYDNGTKNECAFVYGFPNGNSIYSFEKKLDWVSLDPVPFLIKPLRSGYFIRRSLPKFLRFLSALDFSLSRRDSVEQKYAIHRFQRFSERHDRLWEKFSSSGNVLVAVHRASEYLNWRLIDYPHAKNYRIAEIRKDGECSGFVAWTVETKHGGKIGYILELLHDPGVPEAGSSLLDHALADLRSVRADAVLAWCCDHSLNFKAFKKLHFVKMPEKVRPIELHWGVRHLDHAVSEKVGDRKNWYISYLDSDTV